MKGILVLAFVLVMAGCLEDAAPTTTSFASEGPPSAPPVAATTTAAPAAATDEFGAISVTVTTTELQPVDAAQVTIAGTERSAFTDAAGIANFNDLAPGAYTILVAKPGYNSLQDKGRLVDVVAGEVTEARMVLDPVQIVDAATSYHSTFPFKGFLSCAVEGADGMVLNRATPCGDWVQPGGVSLGDPNHKSRFTFPIDSIQVQAIVVDGQWQPTTGVTAQQLRMLVTHELTCNGATCIWNNAIINAAGPSPIHGTVVDGENKVIVKRFGEDPATYPRTVYAETGAYCKSNCTGVQVVFQQNFDKFITVFYGAEPPVGYSALPS